ncbi:extracellular solute-binding protein [Paenibacillus agaridevorans]|uniref:extracellular solute-binding protein n=1 Tax=Paenibacillus agaridevorans TaxID=171404 RepID=UPI001BE3FDB6|nr:extracellular solute-binding protein [Paenibacillus agaridevorans]
MKRFRMGMTSLLLLAMVWLAACMNNPAPSSSQPSSATSGSKDPYVIQVLHSTATNIKKSDETEIGKVIKEKFNIVFEYVSFTGNELDQMNLMLSAGNYPEIVRLSDNSVLDKYIRAGALLPLDDFLTNAPEFKKRYDAQIPLWRLPAHDSKLYKWENNVPTDFKNNLEALDVAVRIDVLEKAGWPELLSTDDYIQFLKQAMKDHPSTNGQKSIGMTVPFAEPWGVQGIAPIMYEKGGRYSTAAGNLSVIWNQVDQQYVDMMENEYVKEGFFFFNQLYREGILDKDSFTDLLPQATEKLVSGRALSTWYPVSVDNASAIKSGHPEWQMINLPIRSKTQIERNEKRQIRVEDTRSYEMYSITKNAKDSKRIFELLEWAASDEGKILLQSGIEGKHYTIENGKRVATEDYKNIINDPMQSSQVGFRMFPFLGYVGTNAPDGVPYDMKMDPVLTDEMTLSPELKNAYTQLGWTDSKQYWRETGKAAPTGIAAAIAIDSTSELGALQQKLIEFRVKNTTKLIIEPKSDEDFEKLYSQIINDYRKLEPEKVVNMYNQLYQEKLAQLESLK